MSEKPVSCPRRCVNRQIIVPRDNGEGYVLKPCPNCALPGDLMDVYQKQKFYERAPS